MSSSLLQEVFPILGLLLSNILYAAPAPAVALAHRTQNIKNFNVLPAALMCVSTCAWCFYALSVPNPYIFFANAPGLIASVAYLVITLPLIPKNQAQMKRSVQATMVVGAAAALVLWARVIFGDYSRRDRSFILGLYASCICVIMFASPLSTMAIVLRTKNAASIYAPLTAAQVVNCGTWTLYGLAVGDIWVWGPNASGLALGLVQVALKCLFSSKPSAPYRRDSDLQRRSLQDLCNVDENDELTRI